MNNSLPVHLIFDPNPSDLIKISHADGKTIEKKDDLIDSIYTSNKFIPVSKQPGSMIMDMMMTENE